METSTGMNDIVWLTMRRMRTPLMLIILVYFGSVMGMVIIPGQDAQGNPVQVSFLDAAYFVAIMATTIGFGEIPQAFTGAQRLYVYLILLPNVVAWLYSVGTILGLFLDPQFRGVLQRARFTSRVEKARQGFYMVCGFGNTGNMIVHALHKRGFGAVVLEQDQDIVHSIALISEISHLPALAGDASDRYTLELAGLHSSYCLGVISITSSDHVNLTVAITCKLLRPDLPVLARSENERVTANMASFGTDYIVDPYSIFAERLFLAFDSPVKYLVQDWLISVPGSKLREEISPPAGRWIICGLGRFGSRIAERLKEANMPYTVVDVHPDRLRQLDGAVLGRGTEADTLMQAGIKDAVGLVAGTRDDIDNLSIIMTARELNPELFFVARQEHQQNDGLFDASGADLISRRALIVARRMLLMTTTPLLQTFLQHLINQHEDFAQRVAARLQSFLHGRAPAIWVTELKGNMARGLEDAKTLGVRIQLSHITRYSRETKKRPLPCICLLLERGASRTFLPDANQELHSGDRLLFAGRDGAHHEIEWTLTEPHALTGNATGRTMPRGYLWRWLSGRRSAD